jgi:hypothetical protein
MKPATIKQVKHAIENEHTKQVVNWVGEVLKKTDILMSPMFFHTSHNYLDRQIIIQVLEATLKDIYPNLTIERTGNDGVTIKKN